MDEDTPDLDRDAILARRERFIARVSRSFAEPTAGPKTKLVALAISGLTTACPCLDIAVPEESGDSDQPTDDSDTATGTATGTQTGPETGTASETAGGSEGATTG